MHYQNLYSFEFYFWSDKSDTSPLDKNIILVQIQMVCMRLSEEQKGTRFHSM